MDPARARDVADIVVPTMPSMTVPHRLLRKRLLRREQLLELVGLHGAELVAFPDDIAAVRVGAWVEVVQEAEHFGRVAAAAEDDEEAGGRLAVSAVGCCGVG